jgi:diguanylate cyclase (GGDEF)-like protein
MHSHGKRLLPLWLLWSVAAVALPPDRPLSELHLSNWDTRDGLPHNMVLDLVQSRDGYLWMGTWEGVARFNGQEFTVFDRRNTPQMSDNGVRALVEVRDGTLWMGSSRGGLIGYRGGSWTHVGREQGLASDEILRLHEDRRGRLWIGTEDAGLAWLDPDGSLGKVGVEEGLLSPGVLALTSDSEGALWVGTWGGLQRIVDDRPDTAFVPIGLPAGAVTALHSDPALGLFAGLRDTVYRARDGRFSPVFRVSASGGDEINLLRTDRDGTLWIGTFSAGLMRIDPQNPPPPGQIGCTDRCVLNTGHGLPDNRVTSLLEDREGNLWMGTSGGLTRLRRMPFALLSRRDGLPGNYVRAGLAMPDGQQWIATSEGLARIDQTGAVHTPTADSGISQVSMLALALRANGNVLVGTLGSGLIEISPEGKAIRHLDIEDGLPSNHVRALVEDPQGRIWVGTSNGLGLIENDRIQVFTRAQGLPRNFILSLALASDGQVWVGTSEGIARQRGSRFEDLSHLPGFVPQDVFSITVLDDALWLATGAGLLRLQDERFSRVDEHNGLPSNTIFNFIVDDRRQAWMGSNSGIFRADIDQLRECADGKREHVDFARHTEDDGLATRQANGGSQPSAWHGPDGRLWFATAKGAAVVDPAQPSAPALPEPPLVVERVQIDGAPRDVTALADLPAGTRRFDVRFAGLSYVAPERIEYRYRLSGFDRDWVDADTRREAEFTNVPPGDYLLEISARHPQGQWSTRPIALPVSVAAQFWQTRLFLIASILIGLSAAVWFIHARTRELRRRRDELQREVALRTEQLERQAQELVKANADKTHLLDRLAAQTEALAVQAREDGLTGLFNRRHLDLRLTEEFTRSRERALPLSVALIDIDHFKQINDRHSHATGDTVLVEVADALQRQAPDGSLLARYGGEEFALILPDTDAATALSLCERMRLEVESLAPDNWPEGLKVTVSIGLANDPDAQSGERLLAAADAALYAAKRGGRNRVLRSESASGG